MDLPALATCSYTAYRRDMGTAVRITRQPPRWISLPDERYTMYSHWPYVEQLAPKSAWRDAPIDDFMRLYFDQLNSQRDLIVEKLGMIPLEHGRLVLLCFDKDVSDPRNCHRTMFAAWWERVFGAVVPELGGGK